VTIPFSFDWGKAFDTDEIGVVLLKQQRAFLLKMVYNAASDKYSFFTNFDESDVDSIDEFLADLSYRLMNFDTPPKEDMNNYIYLSPVQGTVISGNRIALIAGTMYYAQNTPASGNAYEIFEGIKLQSGTWHVRINLMHNSNAGILKVEIIDIITATVYSSTTYDTYNATQTDQHFDLASFALTDSAFVKIKISCTGKHASSSNFFLFISAIQLYRDS